MKNVAILILIFLFPPSSAIADTANGGYIIYKQITDSGKSRYILQFENNGGVESFVIAGHILLCGQTITHKNGDLNNKSPASPMQVWDIGYYERYPGKSKRVRFTKFCGIKLKGWWHFVQFNKKDHTEWILLKSSIKKINTQIFKV